MASQHNVYPTGTFNHIFPTVSGIFQFGLIYSDRKLKKFKIVKAVLAIPYFTEGMPK
jgi:hypothetical protein